MRKYLTPARAMLIGAAVLAGSGASGSAMAQVASPTTAEAFVTRGNAYYSQQNYAAAIADYDAALRIDPNNINALRNRGQANHNQGNHAAAIADFSAVLGIDPGNALAYYYRGMDYAEQGGYSEAVSDYGDALQLDPNNTSTYNLRGLANTNLGNYAAAIADFDVALRVSPNNAVYHYNRGSAYNRAGNYAAAASDFNEALRIDPNDAESYNGRAVALYRQGNYAAAIADYDNVLRLNPRHPTAANDRALAEQAQARSQQPPEQAAVPDTYECRWNGCTPEQARQAYAEEQRQLQAQQQREAANQRSGQALGRLLAGGVAAAMGADRNTVAQVLQGQAPTAPPPPRPQMPRQSYAPPAGQRPAPNGGGASYTYVNGQCIGTGCPQQRQSELGELNDPSYDAKNCLTLQPGRSGGRVLHNSCAYAVEAIWCVVDSECGQPAGNNMWTIGANREYPIMGGVGPVAWGACQGANSMGRSSYNPDSRSFTYSCPQNLQRQQ